MGNDIETGEFQERTLNFLTLCYEIFVCFPRIKSVILYTKRNDTLMKCRLLLLGFIFSTIASYPAGVKFYNINDIHKVPMRITQSVCKDENGFIWVSSQTGVMRIAGNDSRTYQLPYDFVHNSLQKIAVDFQTFALKQFFQVYDNMFQDCNYTFLYV